jgi:predicted GIY-YIG superfamily endonuclease
MVSSAVEGAQASVPYYLAAKSLAPMSTLEGPAERPQNPNIYKPEVPLIDPATARALDRAATIGEVVGSLAVPIGGPIAGGGEAVALATRALPEALTVGRNAEAGVDVYLGISEGKAAYAGISNNLARRSAQHGERFERLQAVTSTSSVTRGEARAIEQALKVRNPKFQNKINSISPSHPWYQQAVDWGEAWLQAQEALLQTGGF